MVDVTTAEMSFMADLKVFDSFKRISLSDICLIFLLIALSIISAVPSQKDNFGKSAYVYYNDSLFGIYNLNKPTVITIKENCTIQILDNKIRIQESDCPDKRCVRQGWSDTMPIICLPNKIMIEIKNDSIKIPKHILK